MTRQRPKKGFAREQLALFPEPAPERLALPTGVKPDDKPVSYVHYRPKLPRFCDDCQRECQLRGWLHAPRMRTVRWKRTDQGFVTLLCHDHKEARLVGALRANVRGQKHD